MDYRELFDKKKKYDEIRAKLASESVESYEKSFDIEYTHNSTAIEGNTLSLLETKTVLEDEISIGGKELREIYEVVNHNKAFAYVKRCIAEGKTLDENIVKDIHSILMQNILPGGIYRNVSVRITGAAHKPPVPSEMFMQIKEFFMELPYKKEFNSIELAAYTHAEFVKIHPYVDGNGRCARLIMNYQLMANGFLPISIRKEQRLNYFEALESYAVEGDLERFAKMIEELEIEQLDEYIEMVMEQD